MNLIANSANLGHDLSPKALAMKETICQAAGEDTRYFASFQSFYDWWDTYTGYEQMDADADVGSDRPILAVVFDHLVAEGFFSNQSQRCGPQHLAEGSYGINALRDLGEFLPLQVLQSGAGFYIGTLDHEGPASRESVEYFRTKEEAQQALNTDSWSQRP